MLDREIVRAPARPENDHPGRDQSRKRGGFEHLFRPGLGREDIFRLLPICAVGLRVPIG